MEIISGTPFSVEITEVKNKPGYWSNNEVKVFRDGKSIGKYTRNYHAYNLETFYPFQLDGVWYALYSRDYTATRVAKLDDKFEDWCGDERNEYGFCPVEFYVPKYHLIDGGNFGEYKIHDNRNDFERVGNQCEVIKTEYEPFGFVSGCVWGDDSSWKLRFIDLSRIKDKILKIDERFGYFELTKSIQDSIYIEGDEDRIIVIEGKSTFNLDDGSRA